MQPAHLLAEFWLSRTANPEEVVVKPEQIAEHNRNVHALQQQGWPIGRFDLLGQRPDAGALTQRHWAALSSLTRDLSTGERVLAPGHPTENILSRLKRDLRAASAVDELRALHRDAPLRCLPTTQGVYTDHRSLAFDLLQCSELRFGEPVRVLARVPSGFVYVWSSYAAGWVHVDALTPPIPREVATRYLQPERFVVVSQDRTAVWSRQQSGPLLGVANLGLHLPLISKAENGVLEVQAPSRTGLGKAWIRDPPSVSIGHSPLTRRALLQRAFSLLDTPYGWGGTGHKRDCSRLLMDLFGSFGLQLPRNSSRQALSGLRRIDVSTLSDADKAAKMEELANEGFVLPHFPGHILLFLGRDQDDLYALHQISGYLVPCPGGGETMYRLNRTTVTTLELGRGSSRRSFLERIAQLIVF